MKPLWAHQKKAVELAREKDLALLFPPGTGKSRTMIEIYREECNKQMRLYKALILCPLSICEQWKKEFAEYSKVPQEKIYVAIGSGKERARRMEEIRYAGQAHIVITNFAGLLIKDFYDVLLKWSPEITIIDEAHNFKDATSKRAKALYPLTNAARRRFIMTGTLVANSMLDIFGPYQAFKPGLLAKSAWQFKTQYFYNKNAHAPSHVTWPDWQPKPDSAYRLGKIIAETSVNAKKEDCIDLPPLMEVQVPVDLGKDQAKSYKSMLEDFITELNGVVVTAEFAMTKSLRLRQIVCGFLAESSKTDPTWFKDNPRLDALSDLLESIGKNKTIIWTEFQPTYKKLKEVCGKLKRDVRFLTGEQSSAEKQKSIMEFQQGEADILIAHPAAGSEGVNLQAAPYSIWYATGFSKIFFEQAKARNYRGGSNIHDKVVHYHMHARGTVDEIINEALLKKMDAAKEVAEWVKKLVDLKNA